MSYVIVHKETMALIHTINTRALPNTTHFNTERAAKSWLTKMYNNGKLRGRFIDGDYEILHKDDFLVMESGKYNEVEPMVERTNLMSGKKFKESINTPNYCSPASETYWSM